MYGNNNIIVSDAKIRNSSAWVVLGCRFKPNFLLVGPGPIGSVPSVGLFLRDPSPIYSSFVEKHGKLRMDRSTRVTGV